MKAKGVFLTAILYSGLIFAQSCLAQAVELVSAEEVANDRAYAGRVPKSPPTIAVAGAPKIEIEQPTDLKGLSSPFPIKVAFKSEGNSDISVDSFRILYGMLKIDITDRVLKKTRVTKEGLEVKEAAIPVGSHTLVMRIRDSAGREGELRLGLSVVQ